MAKKNIIFAPLSTFVTLIVDSGDNYTAARRVSHALCFSRCEKCHSAV